MCGFIPVFTFTDVPGHAQTGPRFVIMSLRCLDDSVLIYRWIGQQNDQPGYVVFRARGV